jgi:hypothetical protein
MKSDSFSGKEEIASGPMHLNPAFFTAKTPSAPSNLQKPINRRLIVRLGFTLGRLFFLQNPALLAVDPMFLDASALGIA